VQNGKVKDIKINSLYMSLAQKLRNEKQAPQMTLKTSKRKFKRLPQSIDTNSLEDLRSSGIRDNHQHKKRPILKSLDFERLVYSPRTTKATVLIKG